MYPAAGNNSLEWVELYNQMAVDVELSGWRIDGIDYTFPTNSVIGGGTGHRLRHGQRPLFPFVQP